MKKFILITAGIFIISHYLYAADLQGYRGSPLFNPRVDLNTLPFGEYSLIRSYRNITQLVISTDTKVVIYTDRDNQKDSSIFSSGYSIVDQIILNVPEMKQHDFNLAVEKLIRRGDNSSTSAIPFPGAEIFTAEISAENMPAKNDGEFFLYHIRNSKASSLMTINMFWKKLTIRNILNREGIPSTFYSIYIDQCHDKNIKKIIREYSSAIKKINSADRPLK